MINGTHAPLHEVFAHFLQLGHCALVRPLLSLLFPITVTLFVAFTLLIGSLTLGGRLTIAGLGLG